MQWQGGDSNRGGPQSLHNNDKNDNYGRRESRNDQSRHSDDYHDRGDRY